MHVQAEGSIWLALSQLVRERFQRRPAFFPCFVSGVGTLIKHLCIGQLLALHDNREHKQARVLFVH